MLLIACVTNSLTAQDVMVIEKTDNTTVKYNVDDIKRVYFEKQQSTEGGVTFNPCTETGGNSSTSISGLTSDGVTISVMVSGINMNTALSRLYSYNYTIYIGTNKSVLSTNYLRKKSGILSSNKIISETFTGLSGNTTYYYVIYVTVSYRYTNLNTYTSDIGSFTTLNSIIAPTFNVMTYDITDIGETTAKAQAYFEIKNAVKDYVVGFFISTNSIPTSANAIKNYTKNLSSTNYANELYANITELTSGTKYYVRPYIYYDGSYHYGSITSFTTKSLSQTFNISNSGATDITKTSANVYAIFDIKNAAKAYRIGFFVSTNSTPTSANAIKDAYKNMTDANYSKMTSEKIDNLKPGTKYYVRPYILYDGTYHYGTISSFTTKSDDPAPVTKGTLNGHDWVDLGLPSGTKWATCNVGATRPEGYGDYFAWGETSTKAKSDYTRNKYKYYDSSTGKYKDIGTNISGTSYDAARSKWGSSWRMPTIDEWCELRDYCTRTKDTVNGVKGTRITGKNGNSIFLPWAGWCVEGYNDDNSPNGKGYFYDCHWGNYWASTIYKGTANGGDWMLLDWDIQVLDRYRENGLTIRAVWK